MEKVRIIEGVMQMKFEDIYGRFRQKKLTCQEASELLGVSPRTFLRKRDRYEEEEFDGRFDRRLGHRSGRRAEAQEIARITKLYEQRYKGFSVKHFHEFACREHGLKYGYTWTKTQLEKAHLITRSKRGGDHRLRRERRPMAGMMLHQDGSTHEWIVGLGYKVDLIVTMDDATSWITSAFFVPQEGTESSFLGIKETIMQYGLFCSLYTDRGSHYWFTPEAGGKVSKHQLTEVGRALKQLGIQHIAAYSPQARGRSERMFGTLQDRLPKELELAGITSLAEANRYLQEVYLPRHNQQFSVKAKEPDSAYVSWVGLSLDEILCIQEERTVQNDNTVRYKGKILQIPKDNLRHHYIKTTVQVREYLDGTLGLFYGPRCLGRYSCDGILFTERTKHEAA
jgi:transposase